MTTHLLTLAAPGGADAARALARTVRRHHPDWVTWLLLTDHGPVGEGWFDHVLHPGEVAGEAAALLRVLDAGAGGVFRLHPGAVLIGPLGEAAALLTTEPVVLTPGGGLLGLRGTEKGRTWVQAWAERGGPMPDPPPGTAVLRHPGYGAALTDATLAFGPDGALRVAGEPVRLLHLGDAGGVAHRLPPGRTEPLDLLRWIRAEREDARVAGPPLPGPPLPGPDAGRAEYLAWQAREFARGEAAARGAGARFRAAALAVARRLPAPVWRALSRASRRLRGG